MTDLVVEDLTRAYGAFKAIDRVSFAIEEGQFVTLLGPSGCGKSTTLWLLAGLDAPTSGSIHHRGRAIADASRNIFVPPEKRDFGLVFQSYAVWPHMTVRKNLEYPLRLRRTKRREVDERIEEVADLVEMREQLDKYPYQLSGGQQQRVALARTLVYRPHLLLLDEPLSNLDAKLRMRARSWLKRLHSSLGLTTIYVTHDQSEALAMSDEVIVLEHGRIVQRGTPEDIYLRPESEFVADFIGNSNLVGAIVRGVDDAAATVELGDGTTLAVPSAGRHKGEAVSVSIRQEAMHFAPPGDGAATSVPSKVMNVSYVGAAYEVEFMFGGTRCIGLSRTRPEGPEITVHVRQEDCRVFCASKNGEVERA